MKLKRIIAIIFIVLFVITVLIFCLYGKLTILEGVGIISVGVVIIKIISYLLDLITGDETKHSVKLKDSFFKPLLNELEKEDNNKYCKIEARYDKASEKIILFKPIEPDDLQFYHEVLNNSKKYKQFFMDWNYLKDITLELNTELTNLFDEIRIHVKEKIDLPYYCSYPQLDTPRAYLCPDAFIRAIYEEIKCSLETEKKQLYGLGEIKEGTISEHKYWYFKWGNDLPLVVSYNKEHIETAKEVFSNFIKDIKNKNKFIDFLDKKNKTYNLALKNTKRDLIEIIETIELNN